MTSTKNIAEEAKELLKLLIATPSPSREEAKTADIIFDFLQSKNLNPKRIFNNVWARCKFYDESKPTLLLNSHHDTVKPTTAYTRNPYSPDEENGKLYGLGSNDAGASAVCLLQTFCKFYDKNLPFNIVVGIVGEEEVQGHNGTEVLLNEIGKIDFAIVGEPTQMQAAVGERGLMVFDCTAHGKTGHAARNEGVNAIYIAKDDIDWFQTFKFDKKSKLLGDIKMTVTQINAGTQHNVIPPECGFVVDIRTTDVYTNEEVAEIIKSHIKSEAHERSTRIRASAISENHILIRAAKAIERSTFVSPTTSDMALMNFPSLKMGVGDSSRSHSADEFVYINEICEGIEIYAEMIEKIAELID